jgi:hypothetical protein
VGYGLSVAPQNRREDEDGAGYTLGSSSLLRLEASRARVFQSSLKTGRGSVWMVHVASSWRSHGIEAEDGMFDGVGCGTVEGGPIYPSVVVVFILAHMGFLVFYFHI